MHHVLDRGVARQAREKAFRGRLRDWDGEKAFLQTLRCGGLRSAAARLDLSITKARRRMVDFERQIGAPLFTRGGNGLTVAGSSVVSSGGGGNPASVDPISAGHDVTATRAAKAWLAVTRGLQRL